MKYLYIALIIFTLCAILIPPLHYSYIYPTGNDDTAHHLETIEGNPDAQFPDSGYYAPLLLKLPNPPDTAFFWFNYISLIVIALTLYYVASKLFNPLSGLLAVWMCMFLAPAFYMMFYQGAIFNLTGMYILGLLSILATCLWLRTRRPYHAVLSLLLLIVTPLYHPSGYYILAGIAIYVVVRLILEGIKKNLSKGLGWYGIGLVLVCFVSALLTGMESFIQTYNEGAIRFYDWFAHLASVWVVVILLICGAMWYYLRPAIDKATLGVLGCIILVLVVCAFTDLVPQPYRAGLDLAIITAFTSAGILGVIIKARGSKLFNYAIIGVIVVAAVPMILHWFDNDSAMQPEDIRAVEYLNENQLTWNSSYMVQERIYMRYTDTAHLPLDQADVLVWRESPQSCRSDPECYWFDKVITPEPNGSPLVDFGLVKIYKVDN